jgi:hypothetical protein
MTPGELHSIRHETSQCHLVEQTMWLNWEWSVQWYVSGGMLTDWQPSLILIHLNQSRKIKTVTLKWVIMKGRNPALKVHYVQDATIRSYITCSHLNQTCHYICCVKDARVCVCDTDKCVCIIIWVFNTSLWCVKGMESQKLLEILSEQYLALSP